MLQDKWIDETFPPSPLTEANRRRLAMEEGWLDFAKVAHKAVQIFPSAGGLRSGPLSLFPHPEWTGTQHHQTRAGIQSHPCR